MNTIDDKAQYSNEVIFSDETDYENLENHLENNGIDVRYINSNVLDGYLRWDQEVCKPVIVVSITGNVPARRRFTMAHELGHLVLDYHWVIGDDNSRVKEGFKDKNILSVLAYRGKASYTMEESQKETQANSFAASFLIPTEKLKPMVDYAINNHKNGNELIDDIVNKFKVSKATAVYRTKNFLEQLENDSKKI